MSLTQLPNKIYAGAPLQIIETNALYPASDGWILNYVLINQNNKIQIQFTPDGDNHLISLTPAITKEYASGNYTYQKYFSKDVDVAVAGTGAVEVFPFLAEQDTYDARSFNKKMLDSIEAVMLNRADKVQAEYTYKGRALKYLSHKELSNAKKYYEAEVENEELKQRIEAGEDPGGRIFFGFN